MTKIESLSYLPTTVAVALKFVELGKAPDAEPADYARVISADASLASKILALANSCWAGVRNRVTSVRTAVNLLGLGQVRTLAISYCMAGLHNELELTPAESELFWEAALSKAIAARSYASRFDSRLADEAFLTGLFQDFAVPALYSVLRKSYLQVLQRPNTPAATLRDIERQLFGTDHTEVGRMLAQKLQLPDVLVDAIALHHDYEGLTELITNRTLRDAGYAASLLPHALTTWSIADGVALDRFLQEHASGLQLATFLQEVQEEFARVFAFFHEGGRPNANLPHLLVEVAREIADSTTSLVGAVSTLGGQAGPCAVPAGASLPSLAGQPTHDPLTGALSRHGLINEAQCLLARAALRQAPLAACCLHFDRINTITDRYGHVVANQLVQSAIRGVRELLPQAALLARADDDGFVILLSDCSRSQLSQLLDSILAAVAAQGCATGSQTAQTTGSLGAVYVEGTDILQQLEELLRTAGALVLRAKHAGGNRSEVEIRSAQPLPTAGK